MQKKLIALAVASALSVPAVALADTGNVTIYGKANVSYDFVNSGTATAGTAGASSQRVSSNVSNIGLKGSEDVGGGLTAVWQVEQNIDIGGASNAASTFGTQNTFVGLSSGTMGTVVLGRHDTPYKIATRGLDVFADGIADNRSLMGVSSVGILYNGGVNANFDGRQGSVIAYISPAMAGLTVAVGHVNLNQTLNQNQSLGANSKMSAWSLAGLYGNGPFFASLAYETHNLGTGTHGLPVTTPGLTLANPLAIELKESAVKVGLGYTQDAFNVGLAYEKTKDNFGSLGAAGNASDVAGHSAWYLGGKYNISGSDAVKAAYTKTGQAANAALLPAFSASQFSLGYDHNLSKRTTVYALYTKLNNNSGASYGLSSNASSVTTSYVAVAAGAGNTVAGAGADPSAVSLGIKHSF